MSAATNVCDSCGSNDRDVEQVDLKIAASEGAIYYSWFLCFDCLAEFMAPMV